MRIVIAGGHGNLARQLTRELSRGGHEVVGLIRNEEYRADLVADGAVPVVVDLEQATAEEVASLLAGADVAVFAAGAGAGGSDARRKAVDLGASVLLADAAEIAGVLRFVQVSSTGVDSVRNNARPSDVPKDFLSYLQAKLAAEEDLSRRSLDWTIVRPGGLTDDIGTGLVYLAHTGPERAETRGTVPRADVAAVLAELIRTGGGARETLHLLSGSVPVKAAVAAFT